MKSRSRRLVPALLPTAGVAVVMLLGGCSFTNPATIATPYAASDGTNAQIGTGADAVLLRNFLLVTSERDKPGAVVGAITNGGATSVQVTLSVLQPAADGAGQPTPLGETTVTVAPGEFVKVGPGDTVFNLPSVPTPPGSTLTIQAATATGGRQSFTLPVLAAVREYASLTPTPTPTPTESESESAEDSGEPTPSETTNP